MELGLGLRTCFSLETKDPIFVNFKLTQSETEKVKKLLPSGFQLMSIKFTDMEETPSFWVSYNFYDLKYPKPQLAAIKKSRLEINTFVQDCYGRKGILVFCDSPFVSRETQKSLLGGVCDFAEWLVTQIYGCGSLTKLEYQLTNRLKVSLITNTQKVAIDLPLTEKESHEEIGLSSDYFQFNDISFFNHGKSCDYVNVNSSFLQAKFFSVPLDTEGAQPIIENSIFRRRPDVILAHRGEIAYLVNSMNRCLTEGHAHG